MMAMGARAALERGDFPEAVKMADVVLAGAPGDPEALRIKATAYTELKLWDKARSVIAKGSGDWTALERRIDEGERAQAALPKARGGVSRSDRAAIDADSERFCAHCGKSSKETKLRACTACTVAVYCSKECQQSNWEVHKPQCLKLRKQIVEAEAQQGARVTQRPRTLEMWFHENRPRAIALSVVAYLAQHGDIPGIPASKYLVQPLLQSTETSLLCSLLPEAHAIAAGISDFEAVGLLSRVDVDVGFVALLPQVDDTGLVPQARLRYIVPPHILKDLASLLHISLLGTSPSLETGFAGSFRLSVDVSPIAEVIRRQRHDDT